MKRKAWKKTATTAKTLMMILMKKKDMLPAER